MSLIGYLKEKARYGLSKLLVPRLRVVLGIWNFSSHRIIIITAPKAVNTKIIFR